MRRPSRWRRFVLGGPNLARLHPITRVLAEAARVRLPLDEALESAGGHRLFGTRQRLTWYVVFGLVKLPLLLPLLAGGLVQNGLVRRLYRELVAGLRSGRSLGDVVESMPELFPDSYVTLVRAGERSSDLGSALELAAEVTRSAVASRRRLAGNLVLTGLTLLVLFVVTFIVTWKVFPTFLAFHTAIGLDEPWLTRFYLRATSLLRDLGPVVVVPLLALGMLLALIVEGVAPLRRLADHARLALFGSAGGTSESCGVVFGVTALLLRAGTPLTEAFELASGGFGNGVLADRYKRFGSDLATSGPRAVVPESAPFDPLAAGMLSVAIPGGELPTALDHLSRRAFARSRSQRRRLQTLLGPALTVALGLMAGVAVVSVYQGISMLSRLP